MASEADLLTEVFRHDVAARHIYQEVIESVEKEEIKRTLQGFLRDHEHHIHELSKIITNLTGDKPEESRDLKGLLLSGYTTARSWTGETGALKALQTAEGVVLKKYQEVAKSSVLSTEARHLVEKNLKDEERHGAYVNKEADQRPIV